MDKLLGEFHIKQAVDYKFDSSGRSTVTFYISLTNKTANYYASRYELELAGENPQNIYASDLSGPLKTTAAGWDPVRVSVQFNNPVIGLNKTLNFTLSYRANPAIRKGQVWEVNLPKLSHPSTVDDYTLNLIVPPSFGRPAYLSPPPASSQERVYTYSKDQLTQSGVTGAFGNFQTFSFRLQYKLDSPGVVILPSDTASQRIFFDSITPPPNSVRADAQGNWLAEFPSGETIVTGQARLLAGTPTPDSWAQQYANIQASYSSYKEYSVQPMIIQWQPPPLILPFIPTVFRLHISNPNSQAIYSNPVTLPPYSSTILTTRYTLRHPFDFSPQSVTLLADSTPMTYNIPPALFLPWQISFAILISLIIISGVYFSRRLHHKHRSLIIR